ncbi:MAG: heavy metal transporter [Flavobacteriales bacterium]|jgi:copper chaperone CopZ|nr:heavy metal transporter [Candidatus Arcticimaribacter sp.]
MQQKFVIQGMTCGNCKAAVEKGLNSFTGVKDVEVDLKSGATKLKTSKAISLSSIENKLGSKYSVQDTKSQKKSKIKELFPLFLILVYIVFGAAFLQFPAFTTSGYMMDFMGLFFIVFSFFKFLGYQSFPNSFAMYDPLSKVLPIYGWLYPFIETALGLSFLFRFKITLALWVSLFVLSITTLGVLTSLLNKNQIQCACLGTVLNLPMTEATLIENLIMIIMAFGVLFGNAY